jgi:Flp pilus assembly protein TadG
VRVFVDNRRGTAALEFALVIFPLMLILFTIIEYGWYFTHRIILTNAVSAGARAGVKAPSTETIWPYAETATESAYWIDDLGSVVVDVSTEPVRMLHVAVPDQPFRPLVGFLPARWLPRNLSAAATMVFP